MEPSFTLGELTRIKVQTIERLRKDELFDLNRQLPIPAAPLRIAIISAETSKGYLDFIQVIRQHPIPYRFEINLFPAFLQGDKAIDSIRKQLKKIQSSSDPVSSSQPRASSFDLLAIIRGGGDEIGLTCFDDFDLALEICQFPIPVITGIGHSTNETVVEMVASLNKITPTEVAYDLLARLDTAYTALLDAEAKLKTFVTWFLTEKKERLSRYSENLHSITQTIVRRQHSDLEHLGKTLRILVSHLFSSQKSMLEGLEVQTRNLDPKQILQRGYSMTYDQQGRILKDASAVNAGDIIKTELNKGTIKSTVNK